MTQFDNDGDLLQYMGTDAVKWAKEFIERFNDNFPDVHLDTGWVIGWFANAIEAGRGVGTYWRTGELREYLDSIR